MLLAMFAINRIATSCEEELQIFPQAPTTEVPVAGAPPVETPPTQAPVVDTTTTATVPPCVAQKTAMDEEVRVQFINPFATPQVGSLHHEEIDELPTSVIGECYAGTTPPDGVLMLGSPTDSRLYSGITDANGCMAIAVYANTSDGKVTPFNDLNEATTFQAKVDTENDVLRVCVEPAAPNVSTQVMAYAVDGSSHGGAVSSPDPGAELPTTDTVIGSALPPTR